MNRKDFLASTGTLLAAGAIPSIAANAAATADPGDTAPRIPPYLQKGDLIGITAPAGFLQVADISPAVKQLESWGFKVKMGSTVGKRSGSLAGTDDERLVDIQQLLDDRQVKAIFCARGGYGSVRIIERIDWTKFRQAPKWIIGFSDITVIHSYLNRRLGIASIHSKMGGAFPADTSNIDDVVKETADSIRRALTGLDIVYPVKPHPRNRPGKASGALVGGNLKTLESLGGSMSDLYTKDKILFVEDVGEYAYSVDRMFWNLRQSGKLDKLAGLVIGGFRIKAEDNPDDEFGKDLYDIVWEKIGAYDYPVCFDFPVGHQKNNYALKCGIRHQLEVGTAKVSLKEIK
ncbi:MAG: LD-carboxypeptidase [Chitinophagaceae bacterium]|nr:MAG: LD-carboxypeptidase [Chitinophagaceae bacterium]